MPSWSVCFDCAWTYSRTGKRHEIREEGYKIQPCLDDGYGINRDGKYGYELSLNGKIIAKGKSVKELKELVRKRMFPEDGIDESA